MTDNEKICVWLGYTQTSPAILPSNCKWWQNPEHPNATVRFPTPDFTGSDAAAITLLPVLVEQRYTPKLMYLEYREEWELEIYGVIEVRISAKNIAQTIAQAVTALIDKEVRG